MNTPERSGGGGGIRTNIDDFHETSTERFDMPIYKHIKVHVTDANGDALPEYNAQTHNRSSLMHCYIEGKDGMRFKIYIKAYKEHLFPPKPKQEKDGEWKPTPPGKSSF